MSFDWDDYAATYRQAENERIPGLLGTRLSGGQGALLDVGCGEGSLLAAIAKQHPQWCLAGFEVSEYRAQIARARGYEVRVDPDGDLGDEETYDLVTSQHVIEHVADDRDHLRRLMAITRPGGVIYVETPLKLPGAWYFRRGPAGWSLDPTHLREYRSAAELVNVVQSVGLDIVGMDVAPLRMPLSAAVAIARRAVRLPAKPARDGLSVSIPRYRVAGVLARRGAS